MPTPPDTYIPISPAKERALYIIPAVLAAVVVAVHLWWAWEGRDDRAGWVHTLAPLGLLTTAVSNLACRSRPRLYAALSVVAAVLMLAGLILLVAREMK